MEGNPFGTLVAEFKESYCYDNLNRLTSAHEGTLFWSCTAGNPQMTYSAFGNLTEKDGQTYIYPTGVGAIRPHAVTSVGATIHTYDASGNITSDDANGNMIIDNDDRTFTYSVFDQMTLVERGGDRLEFGYGIDRQRNYREETVNAVTTKTFYMGSAERVETGTTVEIRRRIGGEVVITHELDVNDDVDSTKVRYQMLDHLGSPIAVYDGSAGASERLSYGTWGNRRNYDTPLVALPHYNTDFVSGVDTDTVRGYTGHEHGDAFGIIHMNGRIYDPQLGRTLQADPFIQDPTNTQSYNRYSYVLNNPLVYTDPSGYNFFRKVVAPFANLPPVTSDAVPPAMTVATNWACISHPAPSARCPVPKLIPADTKPCPNLPPCNSDRTPPVTPCARA